MQEVKINDLIFKELIKRGYSLEGNTRIWNIADSKLWYLTPEQAQAYLDLENSKRYRSGVTNSEHELLEKAAPKLLNSIKKCSLNLVDLGCGDGIKANFLIQKIKANFNKLRYCPIDISGYMVEKAIQEFTKNNSDEIIESKYNISDFENLENITALLKKGDYDRSLFVLLGYTLGNFEINDFLYQIWDAMDEGDTLVIIDAVGSSKWEERAKTAKDDELTKRFFSQIPLLIGLKPDEFEFDARFKNSRIEFYNTVLKDKVIEFHGKTVQFTKGDQIIVAVAYKHSKEELEKYLGFFFENFDLTLSGDESSFLAVCQKSKNGFGKK